MTNIDTIDDLIILGRACPEKIKDGRDTVCTAGYSHRLGFVRVYPTTVGMPWKRWDIAQVSVERDPRDTRWESYKIAGAKAEWDNLHEKVKIIGRFPKEKRLNLVVNLADSCVDTINHAHRSLGIIRPDEYDCYWQETTRVTPVQLSYFGNNIKTRRDYQFIPRVSYRCSECTAARRHDQQILEWGFYEWLRKNPDEKERVWDNAQLTSSSHAIFFLVGNMFRHRRSFSVISIIRPAKGPVNLALEPPVKVTIPEDESVLQDKPDLTQLSFKVDV
jgi:hypothetical protein